MVSGKVEPQYKEVVGNVVARPDGDLIFVDKIFERKEDENDKLSRLYAGNRLYDIVTGRIFDDTSLFGFRPVVNDELDEDGNTALILACSRERVKPQSARLVYRDINDEGKVHAKVLYGSEDVARSLIIRLMAYGADPAKQNRFGESALHVACRLGQLDLVRELVFISSTEKGSKAPCCNVGNLEGETALHIACELGYNDIASLLLESGASIRVPSNNGESALHVACRLGNLALVKEMLWYGGGTNLLKLLDGRSNNPIISAARHNKWGVVFELLDYMNNEHHAVNCVSGSGGFGLLHMAAKYRGPKKGEYGPSSEEVRQALLRRGANDNMVSVDGITPRFVQDGFGVGSRRGSDRSRKSAFDFSDEFVVRAENLRIEVQKMYRRMRDGFYSLEGAYRQRAEDYMRLLLGVADSYVALAKSSEMITKDNYVGVSERHNVAVGNKFVEWMFTCHKIAAEVVGALKHESYADSALYQSMAGISNTIDRFNVWGIEARSVVSTLDDLAVINNSPISTYRGDGPVRVDVNNDHVVPPVYGALSLSDRGNGVGLCSSIIGISPVPVNSMSVSPLIGGGGVTPVVSSRGGVTPSASSRGMTPAASSRGSSLPISGASSRRSSLPVSSGARSRRSVNCGVGSDNGVLLQDYRVDPASGPLSDKGVVFGRFQDELPNQVYAASTLSGQCGSSVVAVAGSRRSSLPVSSGASSRRSANGGVGSDNGVVVQDLRSEQNWRVLIGAPCGVGTTVGGQRVMAC